MILCPAVELGGHDTSVLGKPRWGLRTDGCLRTSESTHISRYMLMILATCCCQLLQLWSLETSCVFPRVLKCLSWCQLFLNTLQPRKVTTFFFFFRWRYSPLWALACRTVPLHLSLSTSITNSLHLLTPTTWRSLSTSFLHLFLGLPLCLVPSSSWVKNILAYGNHKRIGIYTSRAGSQKTWISLLRKLWGFRLKRFCNVALVIN